MRPSLHVPPLLADGLNHEIPIHLKLAGDRIQVDAQAWQRAKQAFRFRPAFEGTGNCSKNRWKRRTAAVALVYSAKRGERIRAILRIAAPLIEDKDDLVQKGRRRALNFSHRLTSHRRQHLPHRPPRPRMLLLRHQAPPAAPAQTAAPPFADAEPPAPAPSPPHFRTAEYRDRSLADPSPSSASAPSPARSSAIAPATAAEINPSRTPPPDSETTADPRRRAARFHKSTTPAASANPARRSAPAPAADSPRRSPRFEPSAM